MTTLRSVANTEDAFLALAQEMPEEYIECRSTQHRMNITSPFRVVDTNTEDGARIHMGHKVYAVRELTCDRCGMGRRDFYAISSRRGHTVLTRLNATYTPPEGYATKGLGYVGMNRGLILGLALDRTMNAAPVKGRGRPRKDA